MMPQRGNAPRGYAPGGYAPGGYGPGGYPPGGYGPGGFVPGAYASRGYAPGGDAQREYQQRPRGHRRWADLIEDDDELTQEEMFDDKFVRHDFVRHVYAILFVQLAVTFGIILFFKMNLSACIFILINSTMFFGICAVLSFIISMALVCCSRARHTFPINLILLMTFTVVESILLSLATCLVKTEIFLMATGMTAVVCIALSLFAMQTKWDFTPMSGILLIILVVIMVVSIVQIFVHNLILQLIISAVSAIVFGIYLVIDTQMIMGGNHQYVLSPDEYILGAFHLYIDIVMIFITIMNILGVIDMN